MEDVKQKHAEKIKDSEVKEISSGATSPKMAVDDSNQKNSKAKSSASEQDLDVFLLGDLEESDNGPGILQALLNVHVTCICISLGFFCSLLFVTLPFLTPSCPFFLFYCAFLLSNLAYKSPYVFDKVSTNNHPSCFHHQSHVSRISIYIQLSCVFYFIFLISG